MQALNFSSTHVPEGELRGYRAMLGIFRPVGAHFALMRTIRGLMFIVLFLCICVDAGIYNSSSHLGLQPSQGDASMWPIYGTNLIMLACLFYFFLAIWFSWAPEMPYDKGNTTEIQPLTTMGSVVWVLHTIAMPGVFLTLILYYMFLKNVAGYRQSQEVLYCMAFVLMTINMLLSNTPILIKHVFFWMMVVAMYFILLGIYELSTNNNVYPMVDGITQPFAVIVLSGIIHIVLGLVLDVRGMCFDPFIWYKPTDMPSDDGV